MTCGIDNILKNIKSFSGIKLSLHKLIHSVNKLEISPRREIWSESNRSHPKEKFEYGAMDPTTKINLTKERRIPPERKLWVGDEGLQDKQGKKIDLDLRSTFERSWPSNNNNSNSHCSKTCRLRRRQYPWMKWARNLIFPQLAIWLYSAEHLLRRTLRSAVASFSSHNA